MKNLFCILLWLLLAALDLCGQGFTFRDPALVIPTAAAGGGTPAFVEFANSAGSSSASSQTIALTVASGNCIVVGTKWEDAARSPTVSDTAANSYTALSQTNAGSQAYIQMFYAKNVTGGALTITVSYGSATAYVQAGAYELSGCNTTEPLDINPTPGSDATGDVAALQTTAGSTANAIEVLIAFGANYGGYLSTPQTSWTEDFNPTAFACEHFVTSSSGSYYGTHDAVTTGGPEVVVFAAFK